jgi:hypothetical protein
VLELLHAAEGGPDHHGQPRTPDVEGDAGEQVAGRRLQEPRRPAPGDRATAGRRQLLDLPAPADAEVGDREALDGADAVDAGLEAGPERVEIGAERRDRAGRDDGDGLRIQGRGSTRRRS